VVWHDFSDLVTTHFNMKLDVSLRFFVPLPSAIRSGIPATLTYEEIFFAEYSVVPYASKDRSEQTVADKRERDTLLVWTPDPALVRLQTVKRIGLKNAGRVLDADHDKWYAVMSEWDYARQGNCSGVIIDLVDEQVPTLPDPPT
jgi:hypothetical protein